MHVARSGAACALLLCPFFVVGAAQTPTQPAFPKISAEALDRTPVELPGGLEGQRNLLLLSFTRDQKPQVDTWSAVSQALQHSDFNFRVYWMPVSAPENALYRWWDNSSLRAAETDPQLLHWEVPLYVDLNRFSRDLNIVNRSQITVLLVDRSGRILWRSQGPSTQTSRASLLAAAHSAAQ